MDFKKVLELLIDLEGNANRLANKIDVTPAAISKLRSGDGQPSYDLLKKLGIHFPFLNYNWIFRGEGPPFLGEDAVMNEPESVDYLGIIKDLTETNRILTAKYAQNMHSGNNS